MAGPVCIDSGSYISMRSATSLIKGTSKEKSVLSAVPQNPRVSFSINDTRVSSSSSVFDILWIQSDFERQKKIKQTYFDIFKGFNMKSENYSRDWNFKKKDSK